MLYHNNILWNPEEKSSRQQQPLIFQFVANNISFRLIFIIAISRDRVTLKK